VAFKKEQSKCCAKCGVEWLTDLSNKVQRRALCLECIQIEYKERKAEYKANKFKRGNNRLDKYQAYKIENRKHIHKAVNLELRKLKDRTEIREFLRKRFDELLEDKGLWDYLNDTDVENKYEN
jgi:hypothetical protein